MPAIQALKPTAILTVPLFIEKIYYSRIAPNLAKSFLYKFPLTRSLAVQLEGRKLLALFGGGLRFLGIGGAPLAEGVERFLREVQFPYAPGYGLTEASPLVAGTAPYHFPFRSIGKVVAGMDIRLALPADEKNEKNAHADGEIQVRGPNIMRGYYKDEEKTKETFTSDGWLKTGDLGYLDKKGYLYIRGRLKNLILSSTGENIYPEEIETLLYQSPLVEDVLVSSGKNREIIARVFPGEAAKEVNLAEKLEELRRTVNSRLASFSRIGRIEVLQKPFEKTPTGKIKRFLYPAGNDGLL
jgi:long-chain acyl-CoA synthetase